MFLFEKPQFFLSILLIASLLRCAKSPLEPEPQCLKIQFHYGFRNELNTFEQTYQKDLVLDGTIKISFWFTSEEQDRILAKVQAIEFFQYPDTISPEPTPEGVMVAVEPNPGWQFLRIEYQERKKTVYWYYPLPEANEFVLPLLDLTSLIIEMIESKPEYLALPPARGGYV